MSGPVPKRSSERRRRNVDGRETKVEVDASAAPVASVSTAAGAVPLPELPEGLHAIAVGWFESLKVSGQNQYYEPSDWAAAVLVADGMNKILRNRRFSAQGFTAVWSAMTDLLTTEGARRRVRLEVERRKPGEMPDGEPTAIDNYRKRLGG